MCFLTLCTNWIRDLQLVLFRCKTTAGIFLYSSCLTLFLSSALWTREAARHSSAHHPKLCKRGWHFLGSLWHTQTGSGWVNTSLLTTSTFFFFFFKGAVKNFFLLNLSEHVSEFIFECVYLAGDDAKIRLWQVPEGGLKETLTEPKLILQGRSYCIEKQIQPKSMY